ncbi:FkbM family methyltransferase [Aliarcobacter cryaerophilus]|uniref:FkbM family methyltransferase n=1 Tax=Aliarcobacter cryaerophilus TaxID=28198 RepID=UPI0021B4F9F7|nr:FkbM family methyltransferase [Aliarcobacter cryaerophilus]MCT7530900.1 FkbM family methyltransferase [Aliarcobacter cryaerophilus]
MINQDQLNQEKYLNFVKEIFIGMDSDEKTDIESRLVEQLEPTKLISTKYGDIKYFLHGKMARDRANNLFNQEPEIFEWIETFDVLDRVWDVGANIGMYSIYMANKGHNVVAFEPAYNNHYLLTKNININNLNDKVTSLMVALNDTTKIDYLYHLRDLMGFALSNFGEEIDWEGKPFVSKLKQPVLGFSIDDIIELYKLEIPNHIKIDVDGIEDKILFGAKKTLKSNMLKSIYVELVDTRVKYVKDVIELLEDSGFRFLRKDKDSQYAKGKFRNLYNYVFIKG